MDRGRSKLRKIESFIRKIVIEKKEIKLRIVHLLGELNEIKKLSQIMSDELLKINNQKIYNGYNIRKNMNYSHIVREQLNISENKIEFLEIEILNLEKELISKKHQENLLQEKAINFR